MTTKDQAIAPERVLELAEKAGFFFQDVGYAPTMHSMPMEYSQKCFQRLCDAVIAEHAQAPDCRTCEKLQDLGDNFSCRTWGKEYATCTNGDQYKPAPKVVLWRTE